MSQMSYEGPEKYIFISYAHKDSDRVIPILEQMVERGYRIWYDDGIAPGSEWPENIAQHLAGSAVCLAFISNNSMQSANCRREVNFALSRQIPFLGVMLEPTQMTLGMEMQLSSQHCLVRENYRTESDFLERLFSAEVLLPCKKEAPEPAEEVVPKSAPAVQTAESLPEPLPLAAPVKRPAKAPEVIPEPEPAKPPKRKKGKVVDGELVPKKKCSLEMVLAGLVLAVVLLVSGVLVYRASNTVRLYPDVMVQKNAHSLTLEEKELTPEVIRKISSMDGLKYLYLYDCTEANAALMGLKPEALVSLTIHNMQIADFSFMENCTKVYSLKLINCGVNDADFRTIPTEKLQYLDLSGNKDFTDLDLIQSGELREAVFSGTGVSNVAPLANFPKLTLIDCSNTVVAVIESLASLEKLQTLKFANCPIAAVKTPFMSLSMKNIDFNGCHLTDLSGFENFTVLENVYLANNRLPDVGWLGKSTATLEQVNLAGNPINAERISFLGDAVNLNLINVSGISMRGGGLFTKLTNLKTLIASGCGLEDVSSWGNLTQLNYVVLSYNNLRNLRGLPAFSDDGYTKLDLAYNYIENPAEVSGQKFSVVALQGNPLRFGAADFAGMKGSLLAVDYSEAMLNMEKPGFTGIYVVDCPLDKQLALKDAYKSGVNCCTEAELLEVLETKGISYN